MIRLLLCFGLAALAGVQAQPVPGPDQGLLVVESTPTGAIVRLDSAWAGATPYQTVVTAGLRRVEVFYTGFEPFEQMVFVQPGATVRVEAPLVRRTGLVQVSGAPAGAVVTADGLPVDGVTAIPTGDVRIRVEVPGRRPVEETVEVEGRSETRVEYRARTLDRAAVTRSVLLPGSAQLTSEQPLWALAVYAGIGAGVGVALQARAEERDLMVRVAEADAVYQQAGTEAEVRSARAEVDRLVGDARSAHWRQTVAVAFSASVYVASVVDTVVRLGRRPGLRATLVRQRPSASLGAGGHGLRFALTF